MLVPEDVRLVEIEFDIIDPQQPEECTGGLGEIVSVDMKFGVGSRHDEAGRKSGIGVTNELEDGRKEMGSVPRLHCLSLDLEDRKCKHPSLQLPRA